MERPPDTTLPLSLLRDMTDRGLLSSEDMDAMACLVNTGLSKCYAVFRCVSRVVKLYLQRSQYCEQNTARHRHSSS